MAGGGPGGGPACFLVQLPGLPPCRRDPGYPETIAVYLDEYLLAVAERERRVAGNYRRDAYKPGSGYALNRYSTYSFDTHTLYVTWQSIYVYTL